MKEKDIQVGKLYKNKEYPHKRWIGAGERKDFTFRESMEFEKKFLVCIDSGFIYDFGLIWRGEYDDFFVDENQSMI